MKNDKQIYRQDLKKGLSSINDKVEAKLQKVSPGPVISSHYECRFYMILLFVLVVCHQDVQRDAGFALWPGCSEREVEPLRWICWVLPGAFTRMTEIRQSGDTILTILTILPYLSPQGPSGAGSVQSWLWGKSPGEDTKLPHAFRHELAVLSNDLAELKRQATQTW